MDHVGERWAPSTVAQPWEVVFDVAPGRVVCDAQLRTPNHWMVQPKAYVPEADVKTTWLYT